MEVALVWKNRLILIAILETTIETLRVAERKRFLYLSGIRGNGGYSLPWDKTRKITGGSLRTPFRTVSKRATKRLSE